MDAKDLRTESVLGERIHDGRKYAQNDNTLHYDKSKPYQDNGSDSLSKVDVHIARPCAIIGPDRVVPPPEPSDAYLKKAKIDPWNIFDNAYCRPPEYPPKLPNSSSPLRNISPRQTFQENMQRFLVPPRFDTVKVNEDFAAEKSAHQVKNVKLNALSELKYCDVPYNVNTKNNEQKNIRNVEACVSNVNPSLVHNSVYQSPGDVNMRPPRPFEAPDLYQYQEYANCPGPKHMPAARSVRMIQDEASHMYPSPYYQTGNVRFKPYTPVKERYPPQRYELNGYVNSYHPPLPYQTHTKYEIPKPLPPHPCAGYPQIPVKYIDNRMNESVMENYQRSNFQVNYNAHYRGQSMQQPYVPIPGNCLQNKNMHPYTSDNTYKPVASNKISYENHKMFEYDRARNTYMTENFYPKEMPQSVPMKSQMLPSSYPPMNCYPTHATHYYKKDIKNFDYYPNYRHLDISNPNNHLQKLPPQFSPKTIAISPSDSITSNETHGNNQEDCGYVSQSSTTSVRSIDSVNRVPNDPYRKYDYRGTHVVRTPTFMGRAHLNSNSIDNKQIKKGIDVRQFLQMWNEGEEENTENNKEITKTVTTIPTQLGNVNNDQEQLYVLGLVNVPNEELDKYEHIQKISKLPDNIKGYNNIELLYQFEEAIESSNRNTFNMKTINPRELHIPQKDIATLNKNIPRPVSPLDVEAKISQSVIHKEVGCNFEIRPCSPKVLNVEVATSVQSIIGERAIEKVTNPLMIKSPLLIENIENKLNNNQELKAVSSNENINVSSCKMIDIHSTNHLDNSIIKTDYSVQDLESNSGVCLASLPRLDNDIELSFPEVNQQFINAIKVESVITTTPKNLSPNNYIQNDGIKSHGNTEMCQLSPNASEKSFSKLSKYRKQRNINKECKQSDSDICAQALRTDSVIIKNPENIKSTENNQNVFSTFESDLRKPQSPINLTTEIEETNKKIISIDCVNSADEAIDFSLNPSNNLKYHGTFDDNNHKDNFNILSSICESNKLELDGSLHDNHAENFQSAHEKLLQNIDKSLPIASLSTESKKNTCDISAQKPKDRNGDCENVLENCCELVNSNQDTKKEVLKKEICKFGYDADSKHMSSTLKQTDENVSEYKVSPNTINEKTHQIVKFANANEVSKSIKDTKKNPHIQVKADKIISLSTHEPDKFDKKYNDIAKETHQFYKKSFSPWIQKLVFGDILYSDLNLDKEDHMIRFNHNYDDNSSILETNSVDAYVNTKELLNEVLITDHTMNITTETNDYENCNFNDSNLDMTVIEDKTSRKNKAITNEEDFCNSEIPGNSLVINTNIDDPVHLNNKDNNFCDTEVMDLNIAKENNCYTDGTNKNNDAIIDLDSHEDNNFNKTKDLDLLIIKNDYDEQITDKNNLSLESITNKCLVEDAVIDLDSHEDNNLNKTKDLDSLITKNDCDAQITDKINPSLESVKNKCLVENVTIDLDSPEDNKCNETKNMDLFITKNDNDAQIKDKNNSSLESITNKCLVEDAVIDLDSHEDNNLNKSNDLDSLITKNDCDIEITDKNNPSLESVKNKCLVEDVAVDLDSHEDNKCNETKNMDLFITKNYDDQITDKNNSSLESITNKCLVEDAVIDLDSHEDNNLNKTNDLDSLITKNDCDAEITDKNNPSLESVKNKCLVEDVAIDLVSHEDKNCSETKNMDLLITKNYYDAQITDENNASFESVKNKCLVEDEVINLDSHENNNFEKTKKIDLLITKKDHAAQIPDKNNSSLESIKNKCLVEDAVIDLNPHEVVCFNKTKDLGSHITKHNLSNDNCEIVDTEKYNSTLENKAVTLELRKNKISFVETNYTECLKNNSTKGLNISESNNKDNVIHNSEHLILYKTRKQETEDIACFETQVLKNDDSEHEINRVNIGKINKKEVGVKCEDSDLCEVQETFKNYKTHLETSSLLTEKSKNKNVEFIEKEKCFYDYEQYKNEKCFHGVCSNELENSVSSPKEDVKFHEENTPEIQKHIETYRNKIESCSEINDFQTLTKENLPIDIQLCDIDTLNNKDDKVDNKEPELRFTEENISTEDFMRNIQVKEKSHINKEDNVALKEKQSSAFELNASTVIEVRKEITESVSDRIKNCVKEKTILSNCDSQILEERNFMLQTFGDYVGKKIDTDKYICSTQLVSVAGTSEVGNSIQPLLELHVVKSLKQLASAVISSIDQNLSSNEPIYDDKRTQIATTSNDFDNHTENRVDVDVTKECNLKLYAKRLKITNHKPFSPNKRRFLKRSLSETAIDGYSNNSKLEILENFSKKRKIDANGENLIEAQVLSENLCNIFQNNRRNSVSTLYNDENVSFCILIDDDCIITEGDETENICFTEIDGNDFDDSINQTINDDSENLEFVAEVNDKESLREYPNQFILECSGEEFLDAPSWVEDVACMETIVADDVAEDIVISTSSSPKETDYSDHESYNEESGFFGNEINHHTDKVKHIYGEQMCSYDAQLVEQLYRTPQMNVNKTLKERESECVEELCYDKDSLEKVLSEPNEHDTFCKTNCNQPEDISFELNVGISKESDHKDNSGLEYTEKYFLPVVDENMFSDMSDISLTNKHKDDTVSEAVREDTQIPTVHSCESSLDDVFSYNHNNTCPKYSSSSSSPEVSSTTSEERQSSCSGILLKITNYNGSRISQISDVNSGTSGKIRCKFTEANDYLHSKSSSNPTRTLITKAAQKYIPPLKESFNDLKVKLPLPQKSLIKLKQLKVSKERPDSQRIIKINKNLPKKFKPKFEDVLKSIDEIQIKMHKEKSKKPKKAIPKVVIKKSENGSHYASTSDDSYNPDLTGRKWQPWVFIEKNKFIDKMVLKNKTRAIYNHRKKTYVLIEKFHKYKADSNNTKFVISQPKIDNTCKGQLKYTIRLKHSDK